MPTAFFNRPRVVWATQSASPHDRRFVKALVDGGWSVVFLSIAGSLEDLQLDVSHIPFVAVDSPYAADSAPRAIETRVSNAVATFQPELVWAGPLSTVAREVADATSLPLVAQSWGYDLLRDAAIDPEIAASITSTIERATRVHVDCDAGRRAAVRLGAQSENIIQFPWGIDLAAFPMRNPQASVDQLTVVSARSMEAVYDVATTIEAFALMARERTDLDARLVLVGSGSLEPDLRRLAVDRGVESQIDWLGRLAETDLQRVLSASTVYVSSSTVDGTSITLLQAMATGLPCIVSDVGGNSEWIRDGETGLVFESGDFEALAKCLEETLASESSRAAFGAAAREEVERRGDWKSHQDRLIAECNALVGIP